MTDEDFDRNLACGDCDDLVDAVYVCACESCTNGIDDDCDLEGDATDPDCLEEATCTLVTAGADPQIVLARGICDPATASGPYDVIRGGLGNLEVLASSIDLGPVECVQGGLAWDRVTEWSPAPNPACDDKRGTYFLSRNTGDPDFGQGTGPRNRDVMDPDPPCP